MELRINVHGKKIHTNQYQITSELTILVGVLNIIQNPDTYNFLAPQVNYSSSRRRSQLLATAISVSLFCTTGIVAIKVWADESI
jgi:hypothetical protein